MYQEVWSVKVKLSHLPFMYEEVWSVKLTDPICLSHIKKFGL